MLPGNICSKRMRGARTLRGLVDHRRHVEMHGPARPLRGTRGSFASIARLRQETGVPSVLHGAGTLTPGSIPT
jgi:hypothetical protein